MANIQATDAGKHKMSAAHRVEHALIEEISAGELLPGVRLDEVGLAHRFGVSRTPVREALSRLTAQGVLVPGEKRGAFVAEYSREQLSQIFEAMHEIEAACARIAAQRLSLLARSEFRRRTGPFRAKKFQTREDLIGSAQSHQTLIDDIFSEDSNTASKGMRDHMTNSFMQTLRVN
jgi:DNA-binding GntR family transcriptional regulator